MWHNRHVLSFMPPDPLRPQGYQDTLQAKRQPNDPEGPPPKGPGDAYIAVGGIIGVLIGGTGGFLVSWGIVGIGIVIISVLGGVIVGGVVGAYLGDVIRKRRLWKGNQQ